MAVARLVSQYLTARWRCEQVPIISSRVLGSFGSSRSSICRHVQDKSLSDRALSLCEMGAAHAGGQCAAIPFRCRRTQGTVPASRHADTVRAARSPPHADVTRPRSPHPAACLPHGNGYALKAGQLTYDCRYSTMHGMPVTGGRGFRGLKPLWYNGVPP